MTQWCAATCGREVWDNCMKKLMTALAILASVTFASGQNKNVASATKALEVAQEAAQNAKKATKAATWLTLGQSYLNAYSAPAGSLWAGATKQDLKLIMGDEKPSSVENVTIVGQQLTKEVYSNKELYFNPNGQLAIINVTKPVVENGLEKALEAYKKAFELDPKKVKEVTAALQDINKKYIDEAYNKYSLGNGGAASDLFAKAAEAKATAPLSQIDTNAIYNAAPCRTPATSPRGRMIPKARRSGWRKASRPIRRARASSSALSTIM